MKPVKSNQKLGIKKETIVNLTGQSMSKVYGGCIETKTASCSYTMLLSVCICLYSEEGTCRFC
jgi:hypothetical protein